MFPKRDRFVDQCLSVAVASLAALFMHPVGNPGGGTSHLYCKYQKIFACYDQKKQYLGKTNIMTDLFLLLNISTVILNIMQMKRQ